MKYALLLLLSVATITSAATVYDNHIEYYATLKNQLFPSQGIRLEGYFLVGSGDIMRFGWSGFAGGKQHSIDMVNSVIKLDGFVLKPKMVKVFPGERKIRSSELGDGTYAYFARGWACFEYTGPTSGIADRYQSVLLIKLQGTKPTVWRLPSLFGTCQGIRLKNNQIVFDKIEYKKNPKEPPAEQYDQYMIYGLIFKEYVIQGNKFKPTGHSRSATSVDPKDNWAFSFDEP